MEPSATALTLAAAAWFAIVQLCSAASGAYLAGRMRHRTDGGPAGEVTFRDGTNGLLVWAVGLVLAAFIAVLAGVIGVTAMSSPPNATTAMSSANIAATDELFRPKIVAPAEGAEAPAAAPSIATVPSAEPANREEIGRAIDRAALTDNSTADSDRAYLASLVAARTNLDAAEAQARVNKVIAARKEAYENARNAAAALGFWTVVSLLISGAACWWAGTIGGQHRDDFV
jgi:hypothetical protein